MKSNETTVWSRPHNRRGIAHKFQPLLHHPFTFIVLVWVFLWLAFYFVSEFI